MKRKQPSTLLGLNNACLTACEYSPHDVNCERWLAEKDVILTPQIKSNQSLNQELLTFEIGSAHIRLERWSIFYSDAMSMFFK